MSFSKARIQRFNEFESTVPPPGAYNPKFDSMVKGPIIEKSQRFHDNKSVVSAQHNVSVCSKTMGNTITNLRTRNLTPRTGSMSRVGSTRKPRKLIVTVKQNEMEKHVEDMKEEIWQLEMQLVELLKKQSEMEEQYRKDVETLTKLQQELVNDYDQGHKAQMEGLRRQLLEVSEEKQREIEARNIVDADLRSRITDSSKRVIALEKILADERQINSEKVDSLEIQIEKLTIKLENVAEGHKHELDALEQKISRLNLCIGDLTNERDVLESKLEKRQKAILELQAQLLNLQCELNELNAEYKKLLEVSSKRVDDLRHIHQQEIDDLKCYFKKEMEVHQNEKEDELCSRKVLETKIKNVDEKNNFLKKELEDAQRLYEDVKYRLSLAHEELEESDKKHNLLLKEQNEELAQTMKLHDEEIFKLKEQLEDARLEYLKEIENGNIEFVEEEQNMWKTLETALMEELAQEKARRVAAEQEQKKLAEHNKLLVKDYQEINEKYAEVVGHQNHRQRIKHVSQLKDKLYQLEQDLFGKNRLIEHLQRVIVKFKTEERRANTRGKENLLEIIKSTDTTPLCSPHKSLTPLKNRTE